MIFIRANSLTPFFRHDRPARHASPQGEAGGHDVQDINKLKKFQKGAGKYRDRQLVLYLK